MEKINVYACWVGNLSLKFNEDAWENYFTKIGREIGAYLNCHVKKSEQDQFNQCWLNFRSGKKAKEATQLLGGKFLTRYEGKKNVQKNSFEHQNMRIGRAINIQSARNLKRDLNPKILKFEMN